MSNTTATTATLPADVNTNLLDAEDFDRLYDSAKKRLKEETGGKEYRETVKEIDSKFSPTQTEDTSVAIADTSKDTTVEVVVEDPETESEEVNNTDTAAAQTEEWLNNLDPNIRAQVEKLRQEKQQAEIQRDQYIRSNEGRLAAEQRKARDLQRQLEQARQQYQHQSQQSHQPAKVPQTAAEIKAENERLKALKEADPFLGEYLEEVEREKQKLFEEVNNLKGQFELTKKDQEDRYLLSQVDIVRSQVANVEEIWQSEYFNDFISNFAPAWVLRENNNPTAESALKVLRAYGDWASQMNAQLEQQQGGNNSLHTTTTVAAPAGGSVNAQAQKIQQERERKANAAPVQGSPKTRPALTPSDPLDGVLNNPDKYDAWIRAQTEKESKRLRGEKS